MDKMVRCVVLSSNEMIEVPASSLITRPGAYGIIIRGTRILLIRESKTGKLFFPGGGNEAGEDMVATVHRETYEEAGRRIKTATFFGYYENNVYYDGGHGNPQAYRCLINMYVAELEGDSDELSGNDPDEGLPGWYELNDLTPATAANIATQIIQEYLDQHPVI